MSTSPGLAAARPTSVAVALAVGWISVVIDVVAGAALLLLAGNDDVTSALGADAATARTIGITTLVMAAVLAIVVYLLGQGSNVARMLVTVVMVVRIGVAGWALVAFGTHQLAESLIAIAIAITALALLWNDKANAYFATNNG